MVVTDLEGRDLTTLVQVLDGRLQLMEVCYKNKDIDGYFRENSLFHQAIIDFTENKPIAQVLHYVNEISLPVRYRLMRGNFPTRRSLDYHYRIRDHLHSGNITGAKALTEEHILANLERATDSERARGPRSVGMRPVRDGPFRAPPAPRLVPPTRSKRRLSSSPGPGPSGPNVLPRPV